MKKGIRTKKQLFMPFLFLFLFSFSFSYADTYYNFDTVYNLSFSCTHDAYLENQHPADNQNCTPLYDDYTSDDAFITNTSKTDNTTITFTFNETKYSFKDLNIEMRHITGDYVFAPESIDVYFGDVKGIESYSYSGATCGSSSNLKYLEMYNTSYNSVDGFDTVKFVIEPHDCTGDKRFIFNELQFKTSTQLNNLPEVNLSINTTYQCILLNDTFPVITDIYFDVWDNESDTIYYAETFEGVEKQFYKDYFTHHTSFIFESYDLDLDSLSDGTVYYFNESLDCNFCDDLVCSNNENELAPFTALDNDYALINKGWDGWGLQLKNDCLGNDYYTIKTNYPYGDFNYKTSLYGLNNGENFTIRFMDYEFNDLLNLKVYGKDENLTVESLNGGSYSEFYNYEHDYNLTSLNIIYYSNGTFDLVGFTKDKSLTNKTGISANSEVNELSMINYVQINFENNEYLLQTMYSYEGESLELDFTTTKPTQIRADGEGIYKRYYYISDSAHQPYDYIKKSVSVKVEQRKYCINGIEDDVTDALIGNAFNNYIDKLELRDKLRTSVYWLFFVMLGIFAYGFYKTSGRTDLFLAGLLSSLVCFGIGYIAKEATIIISFLIVGSLCGIIMVTRNE